MVFESGFATELAFLWGTYSSVLCAVVQRVHHVEFYLLDIPNVIGLRADHDHDDRNISK